MPVRPPVPSLPVAPAQQQVQPPGIPPAAGRTITWGSAQVLLPDVPENPDESPSNLNLVDAMDGPVARRQAVHRFTKEGLNRELTQLLRNPGFVPELVPDPQQHGERLRAQEVAIARLIRRGARATPEALALAAYSPNPRLVQRLLKVRDPSCDWDFTRATSLDNPSPLLALAINNHWSSAPEVIDHLLNAGVPVTVKDRTNGRTALHWAVLNENMPALLTLLQRGANPNEPDGDGHTAVHLAAVRNRTEAIKALLLAGGDPCPQNPRGNVLPPLLQAAQAGAAGVLAVLLAQGVDPFPPLDPFNPQSRQDGRAMDLALENQAFEAKGSNVENQAQADQTVALLEQHRLRLDLTAIVKNVSEPMVIRARPRL